MDICNHHVGIHRQFRLKTISQRLPNRIDWTHVEDLKDPVEVLSPCRNSIFVVLRVDNPGNSAPFTLLDDLVLYPGYSSAMARFLSASLSAHVTGPTYVVNCSIAPRTDLLSSSNRLPSKPRPSA